MGVPCGRAWRRFRDRCPGVAGECRSFWEVLKMRPMVLLASALFPSLVVAGIQAGCSSDDSAAPPNTVPDSGPIVVPEAGPSAQPVTVIISGKGIVVSNDGVPEDGG